MCRRLFTGVTGEQQLLPPETVVRKVQFISVNLYFKNADVTPVSDTLYPGFNPPLKVVPDGL